MKYTLLIRKTKKSSKKTRQTIKQKTSKGLDIPELIKNNGSIVGIKVDIGAKVLAGSSEEKITEGLDGLRERFQEYYKLGARFTKWRAV